MAIKSKCPECQTLNQYQGFQHLITCYKCGVIYTPTTSILVSTTFDTFFDRLRKIEASLCPESEDTWCVMKITGTALGHNFVGRGDTPEEALQNAEEQYKEWEKKL